MKTVVITGASRGIGFALANKFLEEGFRVVGTSTSGKVGIKHANFEAIKLDLGKPTSISAAAQKIINIVPNIDILINNAGVAVEPDETNNIILKSLRKMLEINLVGLIDLTEKLLNNISAGGQVVNLSSIMGSLTKCSEEKVLDYPGYRISKNALNMYTEVLASRLKKLGITVSSVHPGWVKTDMGGEDAPMLPNEAAEQIFKLSTTSHPTGLFWYNNKRLSW